MLVNDLNQSLPFVTEGLLQRQDTHGPREPIPHLPEYAAEFGRSPFVSAHYWEIGPAYPTNFGAFEHRPNRAPDNLPANIIGTPPGYGAFSASPSMQG